MTPVEILKRHWGYDSFRPCQAEIIDSVLEGRDTLGLMPTGGGKSVTFQVPAMMLPGLVVVVTPLISLMKDQVDNLKDRGIKAGMLHSGMTHRERRLVYDRARLGVLRLVYVSPERLGSDRFLSELATWEVSLIVVDEAHCISQWGYDFRPSYLKIAVLRKQFPGVPVLALTASATPRVRRDIAHHLQFGEGWREIALSFHRHNLSYVVRATSDKSRKLIEALRAVAGTAIVYVRSRRATALYAAELQNACISATYYHAGLDAKIKEERQQAWKEGRVRVMVATNAFGMGIDKPDVRLVVHLDVPPSLEEYYQEAGRAGRDGKHSYALLLADRTDKMRLTRHLNAAFPPREFIAEVYERACVFMDVPVGEGYGKVYEFNPDRFCETFNFRPEPVRSALLLLSAAGYLEYSDDPEVKGRVRIEIRRDDFYELELDETEQRVCNALMRLYTGLFADYVKIEEDNLTLVTGLDRETLYQTLLRLTRKNVLHYIPPRVLPFITLTTAREERRYVVIPRTIYEERRTIVEQQHDAVRRFAFGADTCRARVILEYFGEEPGEDCGQCDICVDRRKRGEAPAKISKTDIEETVIDFVKRHPGIDVDTLVEYVYRDLVRNNAADSGNHSRTQVRERTIDTVRRLIAAGKLTRNVTALYPAVKDSQGNEGKPAKSFQKDE